MGRTHGVAVELGDYSGTYSATGKGFRVTLAHTWKFRAGKADGFQQYTAAALQLRPMR